MGASVSKTSVDIVNNSIIQVITNNVNNCTTNSTQTQQVSFSGWGLFNSVTQSAQLNISCLQNIQMTNELSTQIAQEIQQQAESQAVALLPSFSGSSGAISLANYIQTRVTTATIQNCAAGAIQSQQVQFSGVQIGSSATQTLDLFTECMQTVLNNNNIAQGIVQDITQTTTAKTTNPLDIFGSTWTIILLGFILFIIIGMVFAYMYFNSGSGTKIELSGLNSGQVPVPSPVSDQNPEL